MDVPYQDPFSHVIEMCSPLFSAVMMCTCQDFDCCSMPVWKLFPLSLLLSFVDRTGG